MSERAAQGTAIVKHSLAVAGHRTSISLEAAFWQGLVAIADGRGMSVPMLVAAIDRDRGGSNLSSAIRVFVLDQVARHAMAGATPSGA